MIVIITACLNYSECESGGEFDVVHCADDDEREVQMRLYGPRMRLQPNCKLIIIGACFHREEVKDSGQLYIYNQNRGMRTREEIRLDAEKAKKKEELENEGCRKEKADKDDKDEKQEEEVDEEDEGEEDSEEEDENSNTEDG